MTNQNFNRSEPVSSLLALSLAVAIVMAGFIFPDIRKILDALHLLPLLGAIVLMAGLNLCYAKEPLPAADEAPIEYIPPAEVEPAPDTSAQDRHIILGQLTQSILHEVNNAMQPAMTYAQLLRDRGSMEHVQASNALNDLIASQQHASRILQHYHQLSQPADSTLRELPLSDTIKHALEAVRPLMPSSLILQFGDLSRVRNNVLISNAHMAQLFALLMTNASNATARSGMVAVHVRRADDGRAELIIADNRSENHNDENELLPAYRIAQNWRGEMNVEFQPGKGRTVRVLIPLIV